MFTNNKVIKDLLKKDDTSILKNNKLYILKPLVDMEYMVESNEKYQQFITNINK
jgi:hypothetical protein